MGIELTLIYWENWGKYHVLSQITLHVSISDTESFTSYGN